MENTPLIHCQQLLVNLDADERTDDALDLSAQPGSIVSIIGPDHDLKSSWLQTIAGVMEAESGSLYLDGRDTTTLEREDWVRIRTQFAYVHTNTAVLSAANALQNLMLPAIYHKTGEAGAVRAKAEQLLEEIDAGEDLHLLPAYLKKEQRYKIAVARALMLDPISLLVDSPFTALNFTSAKHFKQFLLNRVKNDNLLLILATHDSKFALEHSDQIIFISSEHMLKFDKKQRIQDCSIPEVRDYITR